MADDVIDSAPAETTEAPESDETEILEDVPEEAAPEEEDEGRAPDEDEEPEEEPEPKPKSPPKPKPAPKMGAEEEKKDPPPKPKKIVKGKVNGEEVDLELSDDEVVAVRAKQIEIAGQRALQEAAEKRKEAEKILSSLKQDPWAALKQAGIDVDAAVEKYAMEYVQRQNMTPEQREAQELRQKLAAIEEEKAQQARQVEEAQTKEERQRLMAQLDKEFSEAAKAVDLPKSPRVVARMAQVIQAHNEQDYDLDPEDAARMVKEELQAEHKTLWGGLDGDALLSALGDDVVEKVRKTLVAKAKAKRQGPQAVEPVSPQRKQAAKTYGSMTEYLRAIRSA